MLISQTQSELAPKCIMMTFLDVGICHEWHDFDLHFQGRNARITKVVFADFPPLV